jgi:hypothetical protein
MVTPSCRAALFRGEQQGFRELRTITSRGRAKVSSHRNRSAVCYVCRAVSALVTQRFTPCVGLSFRVVCPCLPLGQTGSLRKVQS